MINASNIFVKYGDRVLLNRLNLVILEKDRIGLVGRNGAGKSTILKILAKYQRPDEGDITYPSGATIGFLHQEMQLPQGRTVMDETMTAFASLKEMEAKLEELNQEITERTDYDTPSYMKLIQDFSDLNDQFQLLGGQSTEAEAERVLKGLGFKQKDFARQTTEFSGGWQMRIELAKMLLQKPDYLFLDEPTNHLDIESIIWLERFLKDYPGAVLVISHDKQFLDNVTTRTVEIELGKLYDYKAAYSKYVLMRAERREKQQAAYENQQKVIAQKEQTIKRFMAKATKTSMAQSMQKQLNKMERIEIESEDRAVMRIRFPEPPRSGDIVINAKKVVKSYGDLNVLDGVDVKLDRGDRVAFVGQNGQGKTTLAKILINEIPATDGDILLGHNVQIGYYAQNQSDTLHANLTLIETMEAHSPAEMRTQLRNILGAFMFSGEDVDKKVSVLSGGERARLALACLLLKPFNLLVLDEPTNHLDMLSKEVLKEALEQFKGTVIIVSHDRDFLKGLTNRTIEFRDRALYEHLGDVEFFLKKRQLEDMRAVEQQKQAAAANAKSTDSPKVELDYETRKRLNRAISNAEKKVERIEAEIEKIEAKMADPNFYEQPDSEQIMKDYGAKKVALEEAMEAWEDAQMALEEAEGT